MVFAPPWSCGAESAECSGRGYSRAARNERRSSVKNGHTKDLAVHDPGPMPPAATYCKHCNTAFGVSIPILGAPLESQYVQKTAELADHMQRKHPKEVQPDIQAQVMCSIAYSAQRVLDHFTSNDPGLLQWRDRERHRIFRAMLVRSVSDEKIANKVSALFGFCATREDGPQTPTMDEVIQFIKSMRDAIEERNLYPAEAQSLVSTV